MGSPYIVRKDPGHRIRGLDSLRFIAALWVVMGHCGYPPLTEGLDKTHLAGLAVQGIYGNLFAAVPAVTVFFVISGFCIHYPFLKPGSFDLAPYLVRRYVRIVIPMAAAILISQPLHVNLKLFQNSILWSLLAELIYYSLYPLLRRLRAGMPWTTMITTAFGVSLCVTMVHPHALDFDPFGPPLSWLVALPAWLLGCQLAESDFSLESNSVPRSRVWQWRLIVWFLSWLCSVLRFHSPIGYPWTLNFFAIAVFFWLRVEIVAFKLHPPRRLLEWAGQWSYSVYLLHLIANELHGHLHTPNLGFNLNWTLRMGFILGVAYLFYLAIEKPGHFAARRLSQMFQPVGSRKEPAGTGDPAPRG